MLQVIADGLNYLTSQSGESLVKLFWFVLIFEVPRYTASFLTAAFLGRPHTVEAPIGSKRPSVSAVVVGHNEEGGIERCVRSLLEQSRSPERNHRRQRRLERRHDRQGHGTGG